MADQNPPISGQHGLDIIHEMIGRAKGNIRSSSFYFLLWGWIIFAGSIGHYLLLEYSTLAYPEWAWSVVIVGMIASIVKGTRDSSTRGATTYAERIYTTVWMTFLANYFVILFFIARIDYYITPLILLLAAASTFLSGVILRFTPLKWGAVLIWLLAIASFMVPLPWQLLFTAIAVLLGYLVPGYMLKKTGV